VPEDTAHLELYLDGLLEGAARAAFPADDPAVRAQVELQRRIDGVLRERFAPPEITLAGLGVHRNGMAHQGGAAAVAGRLGGGATGAAAAGPPASRRWRTAAALAAAVILAVIGCWQIASVLMTRPATSPYGAPQGFATYYANMVASGFDPDWECEDEEFRRTFADHYRQPLVLQGLPVDVRSLGLAYVSALSPRTTCVLVRAHGAPVIVFVDRVETDPGTERLERGSLNLFRRQLSGLVLYELTPLEAPAVLEHFSIPGGG
jgi:hypothetical protein